MSTDDLSMSTQGLVELNPKLADVSHHTRIAYAKFMTTKLKKEISFEDEKITIENEIIRARESKAFNKFKTNAGILKKRISESKLNKEVEETAKETNVSVVEHHPEPTPSPIPSTNEEDYKDFRARTPIEEDPNEDTQTPDRCLTPENILDEPVPQISSSPISTTASPLSPSPGPPDNRKADSPIVKLKSQSTTPDSVKSPEPSLLKTPEEDDDDDEDDEPDKSDKDATHLNVPNAASPPVSSVPSISTGDKGKSKITGKTLTGWI